MESEGTRPDLFLDLAFKGVGQLRATLGLDEFTYLSLAGSAQADPRAYVVYGTLDEVEKTAIQVMRLRDLIVDDPDQGDADVHARLVEVHIYEEQQVRARRLVEALVLLVLFSRTNEQDHYKHLLLLTELDGYLRANQELEDFHGAASKNVEWSIQRLLSEAKQLEARIDIDRAWYLKEPKPLNSQRLRVDLSTMRSRTKAALPYTTPFEKLCLGTTYAQGFGRSSKAIHFAVSAGTPVTPDQLKGATKHIELLAFSVLRRCHELLGKPDVPIAKQLDRVLASNNEPARLVGLLTVREIVIGDFVVANGYLAEVLDIATSDFGYRSYFVEYLSGSPISEITRDWLPARYVTKLFEAQKLLDGVRGIPDKFGLADASASSLRSVDAATLQPELRRSVVEAWERHGLREHVLRRRSSRPS